MDKSQLRKQLKHKRQALSDQYRLEAAKQLTQLFSTQAIFQKKQTIACYLSTKNELNLQYLIEHIWQSGKTCCIPIIANDPSDKILNFARYDKNTKLSQNQFQIDEPTRPDLIDINQIELLLIPLVGFDKAGHRLGMGGGYYDHTLAQFKQATARPTLIGCGFACQEASAIPQEKTDIIMDAILTETGLHQITNALNPPAQSAG